MHIFCLSFCCMKAQTPPVLVTRGKEKSEIVQHIHILPTTLIRSNIHYITITSEFVIPAGRIRQHDFQPKLYPGYEDMGPKVISNKSKLLA